jgi:hypothetical protein
MSSQLRLSDWFLDPQRSWSDRRQFVSLGISSFPASDALNVFPELIGVEERIGDFALTEKPEVMTSEWPTNHDLTGGLS